MGALDLYVTREMDVSINHTELKCLLGFASPSSAPVLFRAIDCIDDDITIPTADLPAFDAELAAIIVKCDEHPTILRIVPQLRAVIQCARETGKLLHACGPC